MYKIIGANQTEYGPVSAEQIRQWITEGRINAQTPAQAVGDTGWKAIATFPEFAADFPTNATPPPLSHPQPPPPPLGTYLPTDAGRTMALREVSGPAIGLMVTGILAIIAALLGLVQNLAGIGNPDLSNIPNLPPQFEELIRMRQSSGGAVGVFTFVLLIALAAFILYGGIKLKSLQNHTLCLIAAIMAILPCNCPCCCIGLPMGIWALIVMNKPEVRGYFS